MPLAIGKMGKAISDAHTRGFTHIPTIFVAIEVKANWVGFQRDQRAALATRGY